MVEAESIGWPRFRSWDMFQPIAATRRVALLEDHFRDARIVGRIARANHQQVLSGREPRQVEHEFFAKGIDHAIGGLYRHPTARVQGILTAPQRGSRIGGL